MPRLARQTVPPPEPGTSLPSLVPGSRPADSQERFDLGDVSGSDGPADGDRGRDESAHSDHSRDLGINNPDAIPKSKRNTAPDIEYFFDRTGTRNVCKLCR